MNAAGGPPLNLRSIDLNLLVIFEALFEERSVVKAATRLGLTASAVSHALRRLRTQFKDPLLTRTPQGMAPTPEAVRLATSFRKAFSEIESAIEVRGGFDPATARRTFHLRLSDYVGVLLLPRLCIHLSSVAPGVSLSVQSFDMYQPSDRVEYEGVEIRLSVSRGRSVLSASRRILDDQWMVLMRKGHPAASEPMTLDRYLSLGHLKVSGVGSSILDEILAERGLARRVMIQVPTWLGMVPVIESTDLIAAMPAHWMDSVLSGSDCVAVPMPLPELGLLIDAVWHPRNEHDAGHRWFRELIHRIFEEACDKSRVLR
ncbi:LysR family transcriptional regulator [Variovorax paradoxus]|jgi:DNA-binding transcriptional LysR family regulator|uniref:LysR family transcriptional regulator n=1 Tax=Variovorax paradoxus TaxID=34073 RepID=UPI0006E69581|nr:LysR family transcriptional regulator [Variovorax paradoxus]KPV04825.1 LysR family transcriptional regulator [Variovorax paradoxus]KPV07033.1 LysR family transcriptional regulator [Variovorax paradoxus]KPV21423.1 LysR family transcriptional regulator [Variovorax paradoxus]KPV30722.1 LysR family transcriptional regulator [Variovorax paradoxus]